MKGKKTIAALLAAMMTAGCLAPAAYAAEPTVSMDETVYINLDHYGKTSDVNIVKGCSTNGLTKFTDYGSYTSVKNMSNQIEPQTGTDSVSWELDGNTTRFYYECKPKNEPVLPWTFDISYRLNGVPADPKTLAGASGLVEIKIQAIPNAKAAPYYQHNMVLEVMATVDMENALSVEAPGGQLQSMGSTTAVIFAALPGEEKEFTIRIGSESFELGSITMMMEPAKLSQLDRVKDLKEAKETVEDSADAIYDSLNQTLDQVQALRSGIRELKGGLSSLDQARQTIHEANDTTTVQAGQSLDDLEGLIKESEKMPEHLRQGQQALEDVNRNMNSAIATLNQLTPQLTQLQNCLTDIQADVHKIDNALKEIQDASNRAKKAMGDLSDDMSDLRGDLDGIEDNLDSLNRHLKDLQDSLDDLASASGSTLTPALEKYFEAQAKEQIAKLMATGMTQEQATKIVMEQINQQKDALTGNLGSTLRAFRGSLGDLQGITSDLSSACATGRGLLKSMEKLTGTLEDLFDATGDAAGALGDITDNIDKVSDAAKDVLETSKQLITHANELNQTANKYHGEWVGTLKDSESLVTQLNQTMADSHTLLTSLHNLVTASRADLNGGTQKSITGMQKVLDESLKGLDHADTIRKANDTVKQTLDDEIDKIQTETHLLDIDPDAAKISFTSERNPEPESLQVILRTDEISTGTEQTDITEIEQAPTDEGIWARICKVFQKIWEAITSIFSDDE